MSTPLTDAWLAVRASSVLCQNTAAQIQSAALGSDPAQMQSAESAFQVIQDAQTAVLDSQIQVLALLLQGVTPPS
jgi:hypothetical protein